MGWLTGGREGDPEAFFASAEWYDFGSDILAFGPKTCCIFGSLCRMAKSSGVSPMKIQPFLSA